MKYMKTNDNSQKTRSDYVRHDGGKGVKDTVKKDVSQEYLQYMMLGYYKNNVSR